MESVGERSERSEHQYDVISIRTNHTYARCLTPYLPTSNDPHSIVPVPVAPPTYRDVSVTDEGVEEVLYDDIRPRKAKKEVVEDVYDDILSLKAKKRVKEDGYDDIRSQKAKERVKEDGYDDIQSQKAKEGVKDNGYDDAHSRRPQ